MAASRSRRDVARMLREDVAPPIGEQDAFVAVLAAQARATAVATPAVPPRRLAKLVATAVTVAACTVGVAVAADRGLFPAPATPEQAPPAGLPSDSSDARPVDEGVELDEEQQEPGRTPAGDRPSDPAAPEDGSTESGSEPVGAPTGQQPAGGGSQQDGSDQDGPRNQEPGETPDSEDEPDSDDGSGSDESEPEPESDESEPEESDGFADVEGEADPEDPEQPEQQPAEPSDDDAAERAQVTESS